MNEEKWKRIIIKNQKTNYAVSTRGRIKRLAYTRTDSLGRKYFMNEKEIKLTDNGDGYLTARIILENGLKKHYRVNRLVANAFVKKPNANSPLEVDHIDNNR